MRPMLKVVGRFLRILAYVYYFISCGCFVVIGIVAFPHGASGFGLGVIFLMMGTYGLLVMLRTLYRTFRHTPQEPTPA